MLLTSFNRLKKYLELSGTSEDINIKLWLASVSRKIENYLDRTVESGTYTEFFDTTENRIEYYPRAIPITSLTSAFEDSTGLYTGSESEITDSYIGTNSRSIVLDYAPWPAPKGLRIIYVGGLAAHGTQSTFAMTGSSGTWTAAKFVIGGTSGAVGLVVSATATSIVIENLYGIFEASETITEQDSETAVGSSDASATISSITTQSLAEAFPDITQAAEIEIRYFWKHKQDFENQGTQKDQTSRRPDLFKYQLQPETISLLESHRRIFFD